MPKPKRGEIWLVRFPFTDLVSTKLRPALVWATHGTDIIVIGIFSQIPAGTLPKTWILISEQHPTFVRSGLKKTSLLKAEKIAVVHESIFQKKLGSLPPSTSTPHPNANLRQRPSPRPPWTPWQHRLPD